MSHAKILVADYDDKSLNTINDILIKAGWTTTLVKNGKDALETLSSFKPDICVIDPMLPGINGFTVSQKIREQYPDLPVVISTGVYKGEKYRRDARSKYGVTAYLEKPYAESELVATIKAHLPTPHAPHAAPISSKDIDDSFGRKIKSSLNDLTSATRKPKKAGTKKTTSSRVDELLEHTLSGIDLSGISTGKKASGPVEKPQPRVKEPRREKPLAPPPESLDDSDTMRVSAVELKREMERVKGQIERKDEGAPPPAEPKDKAKPPEPKPAARQPETKPAQTAEEREALERKLTSSDIFGPLIEDIEGEDEAQEAPKPRPEPKPAPKEPSPAPVAKPPAPKPQAAKPEPSKAPPEQAKPAPAAAAPPPKAQPQPTAPPKAAPKPPVKPVEAATPEKKSQPAKAPAEEKEARPKIKSEVIALPEEEKKKRHRQDAKSNEYQLLSKIAAGGMAEVWKAKLIGEKGFEKIVAIKKILPHLSDNDEFITMFIDEAKVAANLTHPNIAQIYELGKIDGSFFIAMEYVSGQNLRTILNLCNELKIFMPLEIAVFIGMKLASALNYAHTKKDHNNRKLNIVHRDISPQNVLISSEGEIKLVDFGIAKASIKASQTVAGSLKGKLLYMSPEQAEGKQLDQRSDVFSLASLLYECVTGKKLIDGDSELSILKNVREANFVPPSKLNPNIPDRLEKIFMKALSKDVQDRYPTAKEMEKQLKDFMRQEKIHINESDVVDYLRLLFTKDVKKLTQKTPDLQKMDAHPPQERPDRAELKKRVIMPDTGEIRAYEDGKIQAKPTKSSSKNLWIGVAVIVAVAACIAAAYLFWPKATPATEVPQTADAPPPATTQPAAERTVMPSNPEDSGETPADSQAETEAPPPSLTPAEIAALEDARAAVEEERENANKNLKDALAKKQEELQNLLDSLEMTEDDLEKLSDQDDQP